MSAGTDPRVQLDAVSVVAGEPLYITVVMNNPDGTPVNLTAFGSTWAAQARLGPTSTPVDLATDASNASIGTIVLTLTAAQTLGMDSAGDPTHWTYDLQVSGGTVSPQYLILQMINVFKAYTHG